MRVLDLFSGIGGFALGLGRAGFETVAFCEIEPFCRAVLTKHWPGVPIYDDVRTLTAERLSADGINFDVVCGGFPCQPFSTASHGRRVAMDFWPEMRRIVSETKPAIVIAENVSEAPINIASQDLAELGYSSYRRCISAASAGADHQRNRWWLVAYTNHNGEFPSAVNAEASKLPSFCRGVWGAENYARAVRVSDGVPYRLDRIRALGNAVVPQIVEAIGRAIKKVAS